MRRTAEVRPVLVGAGQRSSSDAPKKMRTYTVIQDVQYIKVLYKTCLIKVCLNLVHIIKGQLSCITLMLGHFDLTQSLSLL